MKKVKLIWALMLTILLSFTGVTQAAIINLQVVSGGFDVSDVSNRNIAQLWIDGTDYSLNGRGFNMVVINQFSGAVLNSVHFDTHISSSEANNMATFISSIDAGNIVLSAVNDEASQNMTSTAITALSSLGISGYPLLFRSSWAFIGAKDSLTGSAIESIGARFSSSVTVSSTLDATTVPAPSIIWLLSFGLIGLIGIRKNLKSTPNT